MNERMNTILTKINELVGWNSIPTKQRSAKPTKPTKPTKLSKLSKLSKPTKPTKLSKLSKPAFTLIEMLVVIGIIAALIAASIGAYSGVTKAAEKTKAQDLVAQVALALATMYDQNGGEWPKRIAMVGEKGGRLDDLAAYALISGGTKYLTLEASGGKLVGYDRFGVLDPWGVQILKRKGRSASIGDVEDHLLWFAVDGDGDGIISGATVGGESVDVRATAIVWCAGKDGKMEPYSRGTRKDDVYSWNVGQTKNVK